MNAKLNEFKSSALAKYMEEILFEKAQNGEDISNFSIEEIGQLAVDKMLSLLDNKHLPEAIEVVRERVYIKARMS